ncbi:hypothetical protein [Actinokineospora terrae]|uniref:hypothetical protein n=1 Tax=Actinokineospora terrae TaxID=155974 RepID=UPI001160D56A|nr:hypothetical protein [Actinokineospora terrae]
MGSLVGVRVVVVVGAVVAGRVVVVGSRLLRRGCVGGDRRDDRAGDVVEPSPYISTRLLDHLAPLQEEARSHADHGDVRDLAHQVALLRIAA